MAKAKRRFSREAAFQLHYSRHFTKLDRHQAVSLHGVINDEDVRPQDEYSSRILMTYEHHEDEIEDVLEESLKNWSSDRLTTFDKALLEMAAVELLFFTDVPPKVVINEYMELAKSYGDDNSPRFINGVLDKIYNGFAEKFRAKASKSAL